MAKIKVLLTTEKGPKIGQNSYGVKPDIFKYAPVTIDRRQKSQKKINVLNYIDCVPQTSSLRIKEALLCVYKTMKQ